MKKFATIIAVLSLSHFAYSNNDQIIEDEVSREFSSVTTANEVQDMIDREMLASESARTWSFHAGYFGKQNANASEIDPDQTLNASEGFEIGGRYQITQNLFAGAAITRNSIRYTEDMRSSVTGQKQTYYNEQNPGLRLTVGGNYDFLDFLGIESTLNVGFNNTSLETLYSPATPFDFNKINFRQTQVSLRMGPSIHWSRLSISPYYQRTQSFIRLRKQLGSNIIEKENLSYGNNSFGATLAFQI